jgi:hypothetical protein
MRAPQAIGDSGFLPLGIVASSAAREALLATLQTSCPQWHVQLVALGIPSNSIPHFRVELKHDVDVPAGSIDVWLHIKGALMAAFPADKPNAVTAIDL